MILKAAAFLATVAALAFLFGGHAKPDDWQSIPWDRTYTDSPAPALPETTTQATTRPSPPTLPQDATSTVALTLTPARAVAAYKTALRAVALEASERDDCADDLDAAEDCGSFLTDFLPGLADATPVYQPDRFVGVTWKCGDETCAAGAIWRDGHRELMTGP